MSGRKHSIVAVACSWCFWVKTKSKPRLLSHLHTVGQSQHEVDINVKLYEDTNKLLDTNFPKQKVWKSVCVYLKIYGRFWSVQTPGDTMTRGTEADLEARRGTTRHIIVR